jgi:DNA-binding transcriptional LysR family regulator
VVEGTNDMLMPMLRVGDLDVVLGRLPEHREREGLNQEVLYYEPVSVVARIGHPLAERESLTLADLASAEWILPPPQTSLRRQLDIAFRKEGLEPPVRAVESISVLNNHALLRESDMVGVMPYQVVEAQHGLTRLPINVMVAGGPVGFTMRAAGEPTPAAQNFIRILREVAGEMGTTAS